MSQDPCPPIPLGALSDQQRRRVESHLPLVSLTLGGLDDLVRRHRIAGQFQELFQEGSLALVDAVRTHDAARHGRFAPFAMARIHFAVSKFVHETRSVIRVPFIVQRRHRRRSRDEKERHRPNPSPRVLRLTRPGGVVARSASSPSDPFDPPGDDAPTIGDVVRERYDSAAHRVATAMAASSRAAPDRRQAVEKCKAGRWMIPEPDERDSLRDVARSLKCPPSRVEYCESRFLCQVGELLEADPSLQALIRLSRRSPHGMAHRLTEKEQAAISSCGTRRGGCKSHGSYS